MNGHAVAIGQRTARAGDPEGGCRRQVLTYLNERHLLTGRAREVRQVRRGNYEKGQTVQPYSEAAFVRGLTPAGRQARGELIQAGQRAPVAGGRVPKGAGQLGETMMADEIRCSVELRADDSMASPGRLTGVLMTYGQRAGDRAELFESGALSWPSNGVVLRRQHQRGAPIMRVVPELRGRDVVIDAPLPCTEAGRSAAVEVRDGAATGPERRIPGHRAALRGGCSGASAARS